MLTFLESSDLTPRRSPRFVNKNHDVFVHGIEEGKVSSSAEVIHNVETLSVKDIIDSLNKAENSHYYYAPKDGIYWLRKGSKNPVVLKNEEDLQKCRDEYGTSSIRIACPVTHVQSQGNYIIL